MSEAELTLEQLADASGESIVTLRTWTELGLVTDRAGAYSSDSIDRVRLISFAAQRGIEPETIAAASAQRGDVVSRYLDLVGVRQTQRSRSIAQAAADVGLDEELVRELVVAAGLADQGEVYDEDADMLRIVATALGAGMPAAALLQLVRVYNDALTRVAETENRLFHYYVHEPLRSSGLSGIELDAATDAVSDPIRGLVEPAVLYFHNKAFQRALRDDMVVHLAEELEGSSDTIGQVPVTVLFVDLASFTVMTEVMGDASAGAVVDRFSHLVREAAAECDGRVLKQIGDEFMLVFRDDARAVRFGLSIMDKTANEAQFPDVRLGAHSGTALYREGDYLGATVNIAARVTSEAERGQFLVTDAVRVASAAHDDLHFGSVGHRTLKNVSEPIELFAVDASSRSDRPVDPVCGMAIDPTSCTVRLTRRGEEILFCSEDCLRRFVDAPDDRYSGRS